MPLLSSCNCYDEVTRQEQLLELRTCVYTLECFVEACVCFLAAFFLESRLSFALVAFVCLHIEDLVCLYVLDLSPRAGKFLFVCCSACSTMVPFVLPRQGRCRQLRRWVFARARTCQTLCWLRLQKSGATMVPFLNGLTLKPEPGFVCFVA